MACDYFLHASRTYPWYWARALPGKGIRTVDLNGADHDLDIEHHSYLWCLASAHSWTAVVGSWLDYAAGIRIRGSSCCNYRFAPVQPIGRTTMLSGPGRVQATAPHAIPVSTRFVHHPTWHSFHAL